MALIKTVITVVGFLIVACSGLPASRNDDVELVPPVRTYGDKPIVDTGAFSGWDSPFGGNAFGGLFDNLEGIMERMRQQLASLINRFPLSNGNSTSSDDLSPFPGIFANPPFPGIGGIDLSKGNTTSITKVIDGHTVVINETEYKKEDDFGGAFFKVRIIDVKPDHETTTAKDVELVSETVPKDREEMANSIENEISKSKEALAEEIYKASRISSNMLRFSEPLQLYDKDRFQNIETFDEEAIVTDNIPTTFENLVRNTHPNKFLDRFSTIAEWSSEDIASTINPDWSYIRPVRPLDFNNLETVEINKEYERQIPIDLSRDTYVNEILAKNGAKVDPDAEVFEVENIRRPSPFGIIHNTR